MSALLKTVFCLLMLSGLCIFGCSRGDGKIPVTGTVTWNGSPLQSGTVTFLAEGKSSESAEVKNGEFRIRTTPGDKKVGVTAYREIAVSGGREGEVRDHQYLPANCNQNSNLQVTVTANGDPVKFDLEGEEIPEPKGFGEFQERPNTDSGREDSGRGSENRRPER